MSAARLNATVNGTEPSNCFNPAQKIGEILAYCLILVVSLAGNSLIGIIVYKTKTMRRTINYLIVNMAMSDLLFTIFYGLDFWLTVSQALCKAVPFLLYLSCLVSIESLILIAADRFGAVVFPLRPPFVSSKLCPFLIFATWICATFLVLPFLFAYKLVEYEDQWICVERLNETFVSGFYLQALSPVLFVISLALMTILYFIILFKLKSQKIPGEQSVNAEQQRLKRQRNVLKMTLAIVFGFILCLLPWNILVFLTAHFVWDNTTRLSCDRLHFMLIAVFLARANCAINPCICFTFSGNYRQGLKSLFSCYGAICTSKSSQNVAPIGLQLSALEEERGTVK